MHGSCCDVEILHVLGVKKIACEEQVDREDKRTTVNTEGASKGTESQERRWEKGAGRKSKGRGREGAFHEEDRCQVPQTCQRNPEAKEGLGLHWREYWWWTGPPAGLLTVICEYRVVI